MIITWGLDLILYGICLLVYRRLPHQAPTILSK
jgi:hypothetical protein